jgi:hypothetical protein
LVLVVSVILMIASMDRAARTLRGPLTTPRLLFDGASLP